MKGVPPVSTCVACPAVAGQLEDYCILFDGLFLAIFCYFQGNKRHLSQQNTAGLDALGQQAFCAITISTGAPVATTTVREKVAPATASHCANSAIASSAFCTAASRLAPLTTKTPPGRTNQNPILSPSFDNKTAWDV